MTTFFDFRSPLILRMMVRASSTCFFVTFSVASNALMTRVESGTMSAKMVCRMFMALDHAGFAVVMPSIALPTLEPIALIFTNLMFVLFVL